MKNKKDKIVRGCRNRHSIVVRCEFQHRNVQSAYNRLLNSLNNHLSLSHTQLIHTHTTLSLSLTHSLYCYIFDVLFRVFKCNILFFIQFAITYSHILVEKYNSCTTIVNCLYVHHTR